ncbi:MAG: DUF302 domain-containing protein [Melioribacter sp.]|uniref:DUF302 domain-containing protein n=1 Tax=Melioribacter sp. TaxID=2052167 RepID=UPI003BE2E88A
MNKLLLAIIVLFTLNLFAQEKNTPQFLIENESKYTFSETVDSLSRLGNRNGWKIVAIHDLQKSLKKNGKEVLPVNIIEFCNPEYSYEVLKEDNYKAVSALMPCRISVYEKSDGKTYISRINPEFLAASFGNVKNSPMAKAIGDVEYILSRLLK